MKKSILLLLLGLFSLSASAALSGSDLFTAKPVEVKPGAKGSVVIFMSAKCPCSNSHVAVVKNLAHEFRDFNFVAVHSNADESVDEAKTYFKTADLPFPVIQDGDDHLANELKAFKTPHAFVLAANGQILFKGGVTDSHDGESGAKQYLREALEDVRAGRPVKNKEARTLGCAISRRK